MAVAHEHDFADFEGDGSAKASSAYHGWLLWMLEGFKFRRQHPIGPYVADFFCLEAKLVIELDGSQHADQLDQDKRRSEYLRDAGYAVLRIWNHKIISNIDEVLQQIADAIEQPHQPKKEQR